MKDSKERKIDKGAVKLVNGVSAISSFLFRLRAEKALKEHESLAERNRRMIEEGWELRYGNLDPENRDKLKF